MNGSSFFFQTSQPFEIPNFSNNFLDNLSSIMREDGDYEDVLGAAADRDVIELDIVSQQVLEEEEEDALDQAIQAKLENDNDEEGEEEEEVVFEQDSDTTSSSSSSVISSASSSNGEKKQAAPRLSSRKVVPITKPSHSSPPRPAAAAAAAVKVRKEKRGGAGGAGAAAAVATAASQNESFEELERLVKQLVLLETEQNKAHECLRFLHTHHCFDKQDYGIVQDFIDQIEQEKRVLTLVLSNYGPRFTPLITMMTIAEQRLTLLDNSPFITPESTLHLNLLKKQQGLQNIIQQASDYLYSQ